MNKYYLLSFLLVCPLSTLAIDKSSLLDLQSISVVSGYKQSITNAPAVVKIITKSEIEKYGSLNLGDVLQRVPGLHVSPSSDAIATVTSSRGITSRLLLMYDGVEIPVGSINSYGNFYNIPLYDVERIEIMRGPNSAVFGADAVLGVVNLITSSSVSDEGDAGVVLGTDSTFGVHANSVGKIGGKRLAIHASRFETKGTSPRIEIDRQSVLDRQFGTNASLAPGKANEEKTVSEARIVYDIAKDLKFKLSYYEQTDLGTAAGNFQALDPEGYNEYDAITANLKYQATHGQWNVEADAVHYNTESDGEARLLPRNTLGSFFPDGVQQRLSSKEKRTKLQLSAVRDFGKHRIRVGVNYIDSKTTNLADTRNYTFAPGIPVPVPLGANVEFKDTPLTLFQNLDYSLKSAFISDEWQFSDDWILSGGFRIDDYSSVGSAVTPRLSLVWNKSSTSTYKLLYGQAFRPPSATELSSNGIFLAQGNRSLEPATLKILEFISEHEITNSLNSIFNIYQYELIDLVAPVPDPASPNGLAFTNISERQKGNGFEWQLNWQLYDNVLFRPSWSYVNNDGDATERNRFIHKNLVKVDIGLALKNNLDMTVSAIHIDGRKRGKRDFRDNIDGYNVVNVSFSKKKIINDFDANLSIKNIFGSDAREPISSAIINDYLVFQRSAIVTFSKRF